MRKLLIFSDNQAGVMSPEAERIAHRDIDLGLAGLLGNEIHFQAASLVLIIQIYGGGDD